MISEERARSLLVGAKSSGSEVQAFLGDTTLSRSYRVKEEALCSETRIPSGHVSAHTAVLMREEHSPRGWADETGVYLSPRAEDKI